jgi:hypothetical protein
MVMRSGLSAVYGALLLMCWSLHGTTGAADDSEDEKVKRTTQEPGNCKNMFFKKKMHLKFENKLQYIVRVIVFLVFEST